MRVGHKSQVRISAALNCNTIADPHSGFISNDRERRLGIHQDCVLEDLLRTRLLRNLLTGDAASYGA